MDDGFDKLDIEYIRIQEAFKASDGCPVCKLQDNYEIRLMNAFSSDLVMDLDFFPKFGTEYSFCSGHLNKYDNLKDKLGLAIMLKKIITEENLALGNKPRNKTSIKRFLKGKVIEDKKCYICEKVENNINDLTIKNIAAFYGDNEEFRTLYSATKYFCLNHYNLILEKADHRLRGSEAKKFKNTTLNLEEKYMKELIKDLDWFENKYDYRYKEEPWYNSKDAIERATKFLR